MVDTGESRGHIGCLMSKQTIAKDPHHLVHLCSQLRQIVTDHEINLGGKNARGSIHDFRTKYRLLGPIGRLGRRKLDDLVQICLESGYIRTMGGRQKRLHSTEKSPHYKDLAGPIEITISMVTSSGIKESFSMSVEADSAREKMGKITQFASGL